MNVLSVVAKKIVYVVAAFVIFIALLVSVSRLVAPIVDQHRPTFEKWASDLLQMPVTIRQIELGWYVYQPVIKLNDVTLLDKETKEPALQIQKVQVYLSIPKSLWQRQPVVSAIGVADTSITVNESANGEFSLQELPHLTPLKQNPEHKDTKITDALGWLSVQPHLYLHNIDIHYSKANGQKKFVTLCDLQVQNSKARHVVIGKATLHQELPTEVSIAIQWEGSSTDFNKMHAKMYLYVSGLSLPQWLGDATYQGFKIKNGVVSAKIWANWHFGVFRKIQSQFQLYELDLFSDLDKTTHTINRLSGHVGWQRDGKNQIIAGNDILIDLPTHFWPATNFYISLAANDKDELTPKLINLGYVDLKDIQPFLNSSKSLLSQSLLTNLSQMHLRGNLQNLSLIFSGEMNDWRRIALNTNFNQLTFSSQNNYPGIKNLSGNLKWRGEEGDLTLNSANVSFQDNTVFNHPIAIDQLVADAHLRVDKKNNLYINIPAMHLLNQIAAVNVIGKITLPVNESPIVDLQANGTVVRANKVAGLLPMRLFWPGLVKWLDQAFLSGQVQSVTAILRGALKDFPFNKDNGVFQISAWVKNVDFNYAPNWPLIKNVNGEVIFSGHQIKIAVDTAKLLDIPIANVHAEIPSLAAEKIKLFVNAPEISSDFAQSLNFVRHSPLNDTIGKIFAGMEMSGPIKLKLGLTVPVSDPANTKVEGNLNFENGELKLIPWNLQADSLAGQLYFTESITESKNIQGLLFKKPFKLTLETVAKTKDLSIVKANITNQLAISDLEGWLKIPLSKVVQGSSLFNTELDLSYKAPLEVHLRSNLIGTTINFSEQLKKKSDEAKMFAADIFVEEQKPLRLKLNYDKEFSVALMLNRKKEAFDLLGANLRLGPGDATWPERGLYITGVIDKLDSDKLKSYMSSSGETKLPNLSLSGIDILTKSLTLGNQEFKQVKLKVIPEADNWNIDIDSSAINGSIKLPKELTKEKLIIARFEKLKITPAEDESKSLPSFDIKSLPAISFFSDEVIYGDKEFGQVSFKTVPTNNGINIKTFNVVSPLMVLEASGDWIQKHNENSTRLRGSVKSVHVSDLINSFGFNAHNLVAKEGRLIFNLSWPSAPFAPSLAGLQGSASFQIGLGRIVDVGQATEAKMDLGRMLSIFSLQTIPRRLSFDFSDLFQKGYSFDSVNADVMFEKGSAYTNNLAIVGPVANVQLNGRIGLKNKDYDFTLSVTPHNLTAGLPLIAAVVGGPVGGVAALAFNTVLGSAVSKVATHYYAVKGP